MIPNLVGVFPHLIQSDSFFSPIPIKDIPHTHTSKYLSYITLALSFSLWVGITIVGFQVNGIQFLASHYLQESHCP